MIRTALSLLSPAGRRGRLSILIFHRVLAERDPLMPGEITRTEFDAAVGWLKRWFNVLPLAEAVARLKDDRLPARTACITFDDGYADNCLLAMPILRRHGVSGTFFVSTGFTDGGLMWNDVVIESIRACREAHLDLDAYGLGRYAMADDAMRRSAVDALLPRIKYLSPAQRGEVIHALQHRFGDRLPRDLMMSSAQVREMHAAGMTIGAHSVNHPILALTDAAQTEREIRDSKAHLESLLDGPVGLFAYPNGVPDQDYHACHARQIREAGFDAAVSTAWGAADRDSDLYQLPRFTPWERTPGRFVARMMQNLLRPRHPHARR